MARVDAITDNLYRISSPPGEYPIGFNQFLIDDEQPTLIHTGFAHAFEEVRNAVAQVLDPARLRYVVLLHFEADECGGMGRFTAQAPGSELVCSTLSARLNLDHWDYEGPCQGMEEGATLELGKHTLRFMETPHVHHWDSMMVFEEQTRSLFPSDLFIQPGDQPPIVSEDLSEEMCELYRQVGIFAHEDPVRRVVDRIETLAPRWVHAMHGGTLSSSVLPAFIRALRERPFAYQGKLLGRDLDSRL